MERPRLRQGKTVTAAALLGAAALVTAGVWVGVSYLRAPALGETSPGANGWATERMPTIAIEVGNGDRVDTFRVELDGVPLGDHARLDGDRLIVEGISLEDGRHDVHVSATAGGMFGGHMERRWAFRVDTRRPKLRLTTDVGGYIRWNAVTIQGTSDPGARIEARSGEVRATAEARRGDGIFTVEMDLPDGTHEYEITARDRAGNTSGQTGTLLVDATAPTVTVDAPARAVRPKPLIEGEISDSSQVTERVTLDGGRFVLGSRPARPLADGVHWLRIEATDAAGNTAAAMHRILVDTTERLGEAVLMKGARGKDVRALQRQLRKQGFLAKGRVTGVYDAATIAAVREFQTSRAMAVDGVAGVDTVGAMTTRIVIDQSDHSLLLYRNGKRPLRFGVAVGQAAYPTPIGDFAIITKVVDPTWVPPDSDWAQGLLPIPPGPDNPLGTRWMGISAPSVGIHGTNNPASIGYSVSHGCIRMSIPEVERLFEMVYVGTRVTITA